MPVGTMTPDAMLQGGFPPLVLFDLDGTLLDSAPDFVATIGTLRSRQGQPPMSEARLRPYVSGGTRAMLEAAFPELDAAARATLVQPFLDIYRGELGRHGRPFDGVEDLLTGIEDAGSRWGIVTNKPYALARALLPLLDWDHRCTVLVGGDSLPVCKPDPRPLLHAAKAQSLAPAECAYVGDDERDIVAARAAGMTALVALWGYRLDSEDPAAWQADALFETPRDLLDHWR
jgi:phosphoglycolate phosphatase